MEKGGVMGKQKRQRQRKRWRVVAVSLFGDGICLFGDKPERREGRLVCSEKVGMRVEECPSSMRRNSVSDCVRAVRQRGRKERRGVQADSVERIGDGGQRARIGISDRRHGAQRGWATLCWRMSNDGDKASMQTFKGSLTQRMVVVEEVVVEGGKKGMADDARRGGLLNSCLLLDRGRVLEPSLSLALLALHPVPLAVLQTMGPGVPAVSQWHRSPSWVDRVLDARSFPFFSSGDLLTTTRWRRRRHKTQDQIAVIDVWRRGLLVGLR